MAKNPEEEEELLAEQGSDQDPQSSDPIASASSTPQQPDPNAQASATQPPQPPQTPPPEPAITSNIGGKKRKSRA